MIKNKIILLTLFFSSFFSVSEVFAAPILIIPTTYILLQNILIFLIFITFVISSLFFFFKRNILKINYCIFFALFFSYLISYIFFGSFISNYEIGFLILFLFVVYFLKNKKVILFLNSAIMISIFLYINIFLVFALLTNDLLNKYKQDLSIKNIYVYYGCLNRNVYRINFYNKTNNVVSIISIYPSFLNQPQANNLKFIKEVNFLKIYNVITDFRNENKEEILFSEKINKYINTNIYE